MRGVVRDVLGRTRLPPVAWNNPRDGLGLYCRICSMGGGVVVHRAGH